MSYLKFVNFKYSILKPGPGGVVGSTASYSLSDIRLNPKFRIARNTLIQKFRSDSIHDLNSKASQRNNRMLDLMVGWSIKRAGCAIGRATPVSAIFAQHAAAVAGGALRTFHLLPLSG